MGSQCSMEKPAVRTTGSRPDADKTAPRRCRAPWWGHRAFVMVLVALGLVRLLVGCMPLEPVEDSPVQRADLQEIRKQLQAQGLTRATVVRDRRGRVELQGK